MFKAFLQSKIATFLLTGVLVFVMVITARILVQKRIIDQEISKLQTQMEKVKKDNEQLSSLVQYLNTPEYQEKAAREKLNLRKDGEHVVVLPQEEVAAATTDQTPVTKTSNYKLWFNYFFVHAN